MLDKNNLLFVIIINVLLVIVSTVSIKKYKQMFKLKRESFVSTNKNKFFVLQKASTDYTMSTIKKTTTIGYTKDYHKYLFEKVYTMFNTNNLTLNFVKLEEYGVDDVDILIYVNDSVYLEKSKYKHIDFYMKDKKYLRQHLDNFEYVVYTDNNASVYVLVESDNQGTNIELEQLETVSDVYNFVLEYAINGKYTEVDMGTNRIVLYQDSILGLNVEEDDTILLKNQRFEFMNGVYTVTKVNKYIHMERSVPLKSKTEVCMDEDLKEHMEYSNKHSCEYKNDLTGNPKKEALTWDARCRRNIECPFYDPESDHFGACDKGGYCEMPHNVKQISFTKYKKEE
jgi:hypothetical protein